MRRISSAVATASAAPPGEGTARSRGGMLRAGSDAARPADGGGVAPVAVAAKACAAASTLAAAAGDAGGVVPAEGWPAHGPFGSPVTQTGRRGLGTAIGSGSGGIGRAGPWAQSSSRGAGRGVSHGGAPARSCRDEPDRCGGEAGVGGTYEGGAEWDGGTSTAQSRKSALTGRRS